MSSEKEDIDPIQEEKRKEWKSVLVKEGDTLAEIAIRTYGRADSKILTTIQESNPDIRDINLIDAGQKIILPPLGTQDDRALIYTVHVASFTSFKEAQDLFRELMKQEQEVYIIPFQDAHLGRVFRVTVGSFEGLRETRDYARRILEKRLSDYAKAVRLEMR